MPRSNEIPFRVEFATTFDGGHESRVIHVRSRCISGAIRKATALAAVDWRGHVVPVSVEIRAAAVVGEEAEQYAEAR